MLSKKYVWKKFDTKSMRHELEAGSKDSQFTMSCASCSVPSVIFDAVELMFDYSIRSLMIDGQDILIEEGFE